MSIHTAIVVDDIAEARQLLQYMLSIHTEIKVIGEAENIDSAERLILQEVPDIVFLDVQMPGGDGFELIHRLHNQGIKTNIIFTTAFKDYTIDAIHASAFDYLLKPIDSIELKKAINRFKHKQNQKKTPELSQLLDTFNNHSRIKINTRSGFLIIETVDILYLEADGTYTDIYLKNGKQIASSLNLGKLIEMLSERDFIRISRSICININYLRQVNRLKHTCTLYNGEKTLDLTISRANMRKIETSLEERLGNNK